MIRAHRLAAHFNAKDGREALIAGARAYLNFLSLTRRSGWEQAAKIAHPISANTEATPATNTSSNQTRKNVRTINTNTGFHPSSIGMTLSKKEQASIKKRRKDSRDRTDVTYLRWAAVRYLRFMDLREGNNAIVPTRDISVILFNLSPVHCNLIILKKVEISRFFCSIAAMYEIIWP